MSSQTASTTSTASRYRTYRTLLLVILALAVVSALAMPVAAADADGDGVPNGKDACPKQKGAKDDGCPVVVDICGAAFLPQIASALIQLSIYGGGIGVALTYFGTNAIESIAPVGDKQRTALKDARRRGVSAGLKLLLVGPLMMIFINAADLPWADCINLVPFS